MLFDNGMASIGTADGAIVREEDLIVRFSTGVGTGHRDARTTEKQASLTVDDYAVAGRRAMACNTPVP
ncbi:hypothetical protein CUJ89_20345 [Burkholderia pyrrocinia]|uniref:Uncharacterized protein n=1 Tax=Burkholderia pyrrocinia TaxID=60550 RepID=A0A2Z5MZW4_BURPY|nr:hypothetical protein CUJ89_20345 [Burkholderia pyrrocinia]